MNPPRHPMLRDAPATIDHPAIKRFVALCQEVRGDAALSFPMLQSGEIIPYWPNLIIHKWDPTKNDFIYTFWGTGLVATYGFDITGKYILRGDFPETEGTIFRAHHDCMTEQRPVYLQTPIFWIDKAFKIIDAVILPLAHKDGTAGTVAYLTFSENPAVEPF